MSTMFEGGEVAAYGLVIALGSASSRGQPQPVLERGDSERWEGWWGEPRVAGFGCRQALMKRLSVRLHARLLERSLASLGAEAAAIAWRELLELKGALTALGTTLEHRLAEKESDARPE